MAPSITAAAVMSGASSEEEEVASGTSSSAVSKNPVAADARDLLADAASKRSVRYGDFKDSWTEREFWFVYCAGTDPLKREEIVKCLMAEGMRYLRSSSRPDHERLAGLFLIYTVFCTQPLNPRVLIRVTADDWTALIQLQEVIREKKYAEAGYILHYLRTEKAFVLTYTSRQKCMGPSSGNHGSEQLHRIFLTSSHSLNPTFLSSLSEEIEGCMTDYHQTKDQRKVFFPQHLLDPPQLPEQLTKVVSNYNTCVTEKLAKYRET